MWLFSASGGTDVCSGIVSGCPMLPVVRGEIAGRSLAVDTAAFATVGGLIRISRNTIYDNNTNYTITGGTIATSGDNIVAVNGATVPNGSIVKQ